MFSHNIAVKNRNYIVFAKLNQPKKNKARYKLDKATAAFS